MFADSSLSAPFQAETLTRLVIRIFDKRVNYNYRAPKHNRRRNCFFALQTITVGFTRSLSMLDKFRNSIELVGLTHFNDS
jgi:hypothetical protein